MAAVIAVGMVKDEVDVIEATVRYLLETVDAVLVADNASTDGTLETLIDLALANPRMAVVVDPEIAYYQGAKMTRLAADAVARFARGRNPWIVPFDADEIHLGLGALHALDEQVRVVAIPGVDHLIPADSVDGHPFARMAWRRPVGKSFRSKVAFRWHPAATIAMGNHAVEIPGADLVDVDHGIRIRHFPVRSISQLRMKARNGAAAYAATDLRPGIGAHWRRWGAMTDDELDDVLAGYIAGPDDVHDPLPSGPWSPS